MDGKTAIVGIIGLVATLATGALGFATYAGSEEKVESLKVWGAMLEESAADESAEAAKASLLLAEAKEEVAELKAEAKELKAKAEGLGHDLGVLNAGFDAAVASEVYAASLACVDTRVALAAQVEHNGRFHAEWADGAQCVIRGGRRVDGARL